jgi:hypothetical protein
LTCELIFCLLPCCCLWISPVFVWSEASFNKHMWC